MKGKKQLQEKKWLYQVVVKKSPEAYAHLYDAYVDTIYRFIYFKVSNRDVAEDLTSEVFLKTWHFLIEKTDKPVKNFRALVYRIARNRIIDFYRERARKQDQPLEHAIGFVWDDDLREEFETKFEAQYILQLIQRLKSEYQEVIELKYIEGYSHKEIAEILDKKSSTVRVTLHRAVKKLKKLVEEEKK